MCASAVARTDDMLILLGVNDVELVPAGTLPRYEMKAQLIRKLY